MEIVVHGGAGSPPEEPADRQRALADAVESAATADGPLEAVCRAVHPLELDPDFNAGVGGAVQSDGVVRTEAGVMTDEGWRARSGPDGRGTRRSRGSSRRHGDAPSHRRR